MGARVIGAITYERPLQPPLLGLRSMSCGEMTSMARSRRAVGGSLRLPDLFRPLGDWAVSTEMTFRLESGRSMRLSCHRQAPQLRAHTCAGSTGAGLFACLPGRLYGPDLLGPSTETTWDAPHGTGSRWGPTRLGLTRASCGSVYVISVSKATAQLVLGEFSIFR